MKNSVVISITRKAAKRQNGPKAAAGEAIKAEWRRGVRSKVVLANKAIAEIEEHHPASQEAESGFVSHVRTGGPSAVEKKWQCFNSARRLADRPASAEKQKEK
jgi:hypothetical protein